MYNHRSSEFPKGGGGGELASSKPLKEGCGGFRLTLAVSAVLPPVILGLGLSIGRRSLLLSVTSGVPEGKVS